MKDLILILTNRGDEHVEPITKCFSELGEHFYRFNTETFPVQTTANFEFSQGLLQLQLIGDETINLNRVKSVWYRRPTSALITDERIGRECERFIRSESDAALWSLYSVLDEFWVNRPLNNRLLGRNKLYQLMRASLVGLRVPNTIITNDSQKLLKFCEANGGTIAVKLLGGSWFVQRESNVPLLVFTQKIITAQILEHSEDIKLAPILAQEYIEKKFELRVTIVGQKIFACAIHSQDSEQSKVDWRNYDFENVKHEPYQLPREVEEKLLSLMRQWGLHYGAIDMIVTPKDDFVFLEINPSGQWLWIEQLTGLPISKALAELLANPLVS